MADDVQALFATLSPTRWDGRPFPARAPEGWVHLSVAMSMLCNALMGEGGETWQDQFPDTMMLAIGLPDAEPTMARNWEWLAAQAVGVFLNETVGTGYRQVGGGGDVAHMPGSWWDVEDILLRFRTWSIDPDKLAALGADLPCWIWVEARSLERQLRRIAEYRRKTPRGVGLPAPFWTPLPEALEVVSRLSPSVGDPVSFISALCGANMIDARAQMMTRTFAGKAVEREQAWRIPQFAWQLMGRDVRSTPSAGLLYVRVGNSEYLIEGVHLDHAQLLAALTLKGYAPASDLGDTGDKTPAAGTGTGIKGKRLPGPVIEREAAAFVAEHGRDPYYPELSAILQEKYPGKPFRRDQVRPFTKKGRDGRPKAS